MIICIVIGVIIIYVVGSYVVVYRWLKEGAGPAGLGWMVFPVAPILPPMFAWQAVSSFFRKVFS